MNSQEFINSAMENYPEASSGNCLKCQSFDYKNCEFDFYDEETEKMHHVNKESLIKGLNILLKVIQDGKYFNCGQAPNLLSNGYDSDAQDYDALVQCAIFGEVIYG